MVAFYGFSKADLEDMTTILVSNGGKVANIDIESGGEMVGVTHVVVDESNVDQLPEQLNLSSKCQVSKRILEYSRI